MKTCVAIASVAVLLTGALGCGSGRSTPPPPVAVPFEEESQAPPKYEYEDGPIEPFRLRLTPGPSDEPAGDADFSAPDYMLHADVILVGKVESIDDEGIGSLLVSKLLRGRRRDLTTVSTEGDFSGCEGTPDLRPYRGKTICLFLKRREGRLTLLHGASGIHPVPLWNNLPVSALKVIIHEESTGPELVAMVVKDGPGTLDWLPAHVRQAAYGVNTPEIQALLQETLERLSPESRHRDVMAIIRHLRLATPLSPAVRKRFKSYHPTFLEHVLGTWVRTPRGAYYNSPEEHITFLRFMAPSDRPWALEQIEQVLVEIKAGRHPDRYRAPYEKLKAELAKT